MKEIWKPIRGYRFYEVSNLGRIRCLKGKGRILKPSLQITRGGFKRFRVNLYENKIPKQYKVHRLVATAFILNLNHKPQVNHIDNNPLNNKVSNLEWVTNEENSKWCYVQGRVRHGENHRDALLTEKQVKEIRLMQKPLSKTHKEIGQHYGVSTATIWGIINRKTWKHI